ncbi:MAG: hypothetical protein B5M51_03385 [Anaerolinea sp. 4484_236]|nr:MAG: hypothetical protein B5M51_03385 [Anaerolinea sp. 4484_236]
MHLKQFKLTVLGPVIIGVILSLSLSAFIAIGINAGQNAGWERMISNNRATLSLSAKLAFNPLYRSDIWTLEGMLEQFIGEADIVHSAVRDASNTIVAEATMQETSLALDKAISHNLANQALSQQDIVYYESEDYLVLCGPITSGAEQLGTLEIVIDLAPYHASLVPMITAMMLAAIITVIGSLVIVILLTRRFTKPLSQLAAAASEIGQGNLNTLVPIQGTEETTSLGNALEQMRTSLNESYNNLEQQIKAQKRRAEQLQVTAEVAKRAAAEIDTQILLQRVVNLIHEQFRFDRLGIFLVDSTGEWAELQAAAGVDVKQLLNRGYRLKIGEEGIVGHVAQTGESYIAKDVREDPLFVRGSDVDILSEAILPLQARGEILGVLDIQSLELNAFLPDDITILRILADQIAMALSNARLFQTVQENLQAMRRAYGEFSREAWIEMLQGKPDQGYYCDELGVKAIESETVKNEDNLPEANIPITVRDQIIGTLNAHKSKNTDQWTEEELAVMKSLAIQLGMALDGARLYENTQQHVARETVIREITDKVSATFNIQETLHTAIGELSTVLRASGAHIELNLPKELTTVNETQLAYSALFDKGSESLEEGI